MYIAKVTLRKQSLKISFLMNLILTYKQKLHLLGFTTLLGFASGLPLALSTGTLQAWLVIEEVDIRVIGWLSLVGLPYTYKFLWAPLIDRFVVPLSFFSRRKGWLVVFQFLMALVLFLLSFINPSKDGVLLIAALAITLAFLSASFDVVFDAWRAESLPKTILGLGAAWSVIGYRIAMLTSGALALMLADLYFGFQGVYRLLAVLTLGLAILAIFSPEPTSTERPTSLYMAVVEPFKEFFGRPAAVLVLLAIIFYKFGDAFTSSLSTAFLIRGAGFTAAEVGAVSKGAGLISLLLGGLVGGFVLSKFKLLPCLLVFGVFQAVTNLGFYWLAVIEPSIGDMALVIVAENLFGGMGTAAFVALLMILCDLRFTATQFALLSALAAVGRVFIGPFAGELAFNFGWPYFFMLSFLIALPGIFMLFWLRRPLDIIEEKSGNLSTR
tara:strand:- start:54666 stop:55985 length:1320 start_codon:yes stop_codon:yes gene_type:complete